MEEMKKAEINKFITANTGQTGSFTEYTFPTVTSRFNYVRKASLSADGKTLSVDDYATLVSKSGTATDEASGRYLQGTEPIYSTKNITKINVSTWITEKYAELKKALVTLLQSFHSWLFS